MSDESQETFLSHLIELRDRVVRALVAVGIAFLPAFFYAS
jgi:Sec-independent protein secretion pathway component TatC